MVARWWCKAEAFACIARDPLELCTQMLRPYARAAHAAHAAHAVHVARDARDARVTDTRARVRSSHHRTHRMRQIYRLPCLMYGCECYLGDQRSHLRLGLLHCGVKLGVGSAYRWCRVKHGSQGWLEEVLAATEALAKPISRTTSRSRLCNTACPCIDNGQPNKRVGRNLDQKCIKRTPQPFLMARSAWPRTSAT